jgi:protoporphyrinogen oxidase
MPRKYFITIMNSCQNNSLRLLKTIPVKKNTSIVLGGGLAGLSAGFGMAKSEMPVIVLESDSEVGGLSRTVRHGEFSFDLGGHRFHTKNAETERFVKEVLYGNYLTVPRKSKIFLQNRFFDYPLKPSNALCGMGVATTARALFDYGIEKTKNFVTPPKYVSLEDWVVNNFGRTMFNIYFKEYSEKVWGIDCSRISEEWVSKRIEGLSLGVAVKNAFFKFSGQTVNSLIDKFIYPSAGIGQISDNLKDEIEKDNSVLTNTKAYRINHRNFFINNVIAKNCEQLYDIKGSEFLSSIPLTNLVRMMNPAPPDDIIEAAAMLRYRDLVVVTIMLNRKSVTDLTWMYLPGQEIAMGRIHEPKNWSPGMAPEGKTHIVAEYFCFQGDAVWNSNNEELTSLTVSQLEKLGLIKANEVIDSCVYRTPKAYPLFEVGYEKYYSRILEYLDNFTNLHIIGRTGMFKYHNMDRAIESGLEAAEAIIKNSEWEKEREALPVGA